MKNKLKKVWLITGASQGMGLALVKFLLRQDHYVIATTRNKVKFERANITAKNLKVIQLDINNADDIKASVTEIIDSYGRIDVLVNNAGFGFVGGIEEASVEEIQQVIDVNVMATIKMTQAVLPHMRAVKSGHIMNLSSIAGLLASPGLGVYNLSKFAVEGFSEALYQEVKELGIKVTIVEPGLFRTGFYGDSLAMAKSTINDYKNTVGKVRSLFSINSGQQPGNPDLAASVIFDIADFDQPPLRLLLGTDALTRALKKMDDNKLEFERMRALTVSTDYNS